MTAHRVLIIEDNPISSKLMRITLERAGYDVIDATDGASGLAEFERRAPDLVLLDLVLPDLDGVEVFYRIRAHPLGASIPIFACSAAFGPFEDARRGAAGFDEIIAKPIEPQMLLKLIRGYLARAHDDVRPFGRGRRAMAVDDDPVQLKMLAFRLEELGFETVTAVDGLDALEQARHYKPTCIVSDVMMPRLDGFGLVRAVRGEPDLSNAIIVLATNSYVEAADRALAQRMGADELVLRTPDLEVVITALRVHVGNPEVRQLPIPNESRDDLDREHNERLIRQLDKQVTLNARQVQRNATMAAELAVVNGISSALVEGDNVDAALDVVLARCLDAMGISVGALYRFDADGGVRTHALGAAALPGLGTFFNRLDFIRDIAHRGETVVVGRAELERLGIPLEFGPTLLMVPVGNRDRVIGALVLAFDELLVNASEQLGFAETLANQVALAVRLADGFEHRVRSEAKARRQSHLLTSIFDAAGDGIVAVGIDGQFTQWNSAATELLRIGPVAVGTETVSEQYGLYSTDGVTLVPPHELPLVRAMAGERVDAAELLLRRADLLEAIHLSVNARPFRDEHRAISGAVAVFRDVTDEKKAQAQLMVSDRMASVGMLAAGVAHEINNPLAVILANLEFVDEDLRGHIAGLGTTSTLEQMRQALDEARAATDRVRSIVKDLRIFSRAEEDKRAAVDVVRVLESTLRMAWNEIRHRARLVKNFVAVPAVHASDSRLGQVFLNLIVNAAQAIPEGCANSNQITVTTSQDSHGWVVTEVSDTGPGVPPEVVAKLFTPFYTTKPAGQGTGLGLVICERIVTGLGGRISVTSQIGKGTVFKVSLPPYLGEEEPESSRRSGHRKSSRRGSVLVIDDDPTIGKAVQRALSGEHEVTVMDNAALALEAIERGSSFDVILCDLMMPVMTGVEFFRRLELSRAELAARVVFLTGGAFTSTARTFLDEVPNARMEKPFEIANLRSLVADRVR